MSISKESAILALVEPQFGDGGVQRGDYVFRQLLEDIAARRYDAGEKLLVEALAETYHVSVTPVRDALMRLESHGIVIKKPYQGFYVRSFEPKEIQDLYEVRVGLEVLAVTLACERITEEQLEQLRVIQKKGESALSEGNLAAYQTTNHLFHGRLIEASGNELLSSMMRRISVQLQLVIAQTIKVPGRPDRASAEHAAIIERIEQRDAKGAEELIKTHIYSALKDMGLVR